MLTFKDFILLLVLCAVAAVIVSMCSGCATIPEECTMEPESGYMNCESPFPESECVEIYPGIYDCREVKD